MSLDKRSIELGTEGWGVKEDNLLAFRKDRTRYVEKPFTFSRASEGTIINSEGYIQYSGFKEELITNGDFQQGQTGWTNSDGSLTFGNGYVKITSNGTTVNRLRQTGENLVGGAGINAGLYRLTYDIIENNNVTDLRVFDGSAYVVIPSTVGSQQFILDHDGINNNFFINLRDSNTGNYIVIDNISLKQVQQETPRISYDLVDGVVSDKPHLLLEPARTNLLRYSENFKANIFETVNLNRESTSVISPDGLTNATKIVETETTGQFRVRTNSSTSTSGANTISVFAKSGERNWIVLREQSQTGAYAYFDLNNGTIGNTNLVDNATIEPYADGWYRLSITDDLTNMGIDIRIAEGNGNDNYSGVDGNGLYIYGAQLEQGSYASSYIPTYGTTVTRAAETANNCGAVQDFNDDEGVLFAEIAAHANDGYFKEISINDGTFDNTIEIRYNSTANEFQFIVRDGGSITVLPTTILTDSSEFIRVGFSYKNNDCNMYINGVQVDTDTSCTMPSGLNRVSFDYNGSNFFYGKVKELKVYTEELNDAELRLLTKYAPKDYDAAFTADYVDSLAEFTVLRTEATDKLYYNISDGTNSVSGLATITATQVTISNIDISSLNDGTLTLSVYIEDERKQRGVTVTDTTIKDTVNTPLYSYALQQRATGATFEDLDNAESIIESLNVEV